MGDNAESESQKHLIWISILDIGIAFHDIKWLKIVIFYYFLFLCDILQVHLHTNIASGDNKRNKGGGQ